MAEIELMLETLRRDQQERWQRGERVLIESYLEQYPELLQSPESLRELILGEMALRAARGESPNWQEYERRLPQCTVLFQSTPKQPSADPWGTVMPGAATRVGAIAAEANSGINAGSLAPSNADESNPYATASPAAPSVGAPSSGTTARTGGAGTASGVGANLAANAKLCAEPSAEPVAAPAAVDDAFSTSVGAEIPAAGEAANARASFETVVSEATGDLASETVARNAGWPTIPGYDILSELGRGGMGVVFRARQRSAGRLVALKIVRKDLLENLPFSTRASTLGRFRHEAQAAANLEHDNLVTVYEVGEANGVCFYAMRYVEGRSLYDMLREGPLAQRMAAGYIEPVSRALHKAHAQGILHRDLKPHNILVDRRTDRPLLADFGLAKFLEKSDDLTHAGELLGTPAYMSPEQAQDAAHVTAAADIYSLGATLYHLLTARPPFQAASLTETIRQILDQEPVAPRQLNPDVDKDLETICLKCLQKEPARRYATAEDLADDLRRYLEGRPILARPINIFGRTWRWCRRNPWMATAVGAAVSFAMVSLVVFVASYYKTSALLAISESRLERALAAVDDMFTRVSEDELLNEPGMQPLRKDLLDRALKHYQYFLQESGGNPAVRDEVAAARFRVGVITQLEGARRDDAFAELTAARKLQEQLLSETPHDPRRLKALADTLNALGNLHKSRKSLDEAAEALAEVVRIRTELSALEPTNREFQRLLANAWMNRAIAEMDRGQWKEAQQHMQSARELRQKILDAEPSLTKVRRDLAKGFYNEAGLALSLKNAAEATRNYRLAIEQFERAQQDDRRSMANRYDLSVAQRSLGGLLSEAGDIPGALAAYGAAQKEMLSLAVGNPSVTQYQEQLAILAMNRAMLYEDQTETGEAIKAWNEALDVANELQRLVPKNLDYARDRAVILSALGDDYLATKQVEAARKSLESAQELLKDLVAQQPDDPGFKEQLAGVETQLRELKSKP